MKTHRKVSKVIYIERGPDEISVLVSAYPEKEYGKIVLRDFSSDHELNEAETEKAHEELTDLALSRSFDFTSPDGDDKGD